jgi:xanthine dehydrogenase accessory factor
MKGTEMGLIAPDIMDRVAELKSAGEPFALATVVRTVSVTAAKAGAKAVIRADGSISDGWIGGGCARGAVLKAAREAMSDGQPRLISVSPEDVLNERGVAPGETRDGIKFARNMCPSQGTMDIFVEPILPQPALTVCGTSPVALALLDLAPRFGFSVTACAPVAEHAAYPAGLRVIEGYDLPKAAAASHFVVVATQGKGDEAALRGALETEAGFTAFVGSRRKMAALRATLQDSAGKDRLDAVQAPAGLDLGAITPDEIALSILAAMIRHRRLGQRSTGQT